jgi:2-(1,2-epoxy-1,2-dihydrophenyl)acetyl-CoA isomerase
MSTEAEYVRIEDGVLEITLSTAAKGTSLDFAGVTAGTTALNESGSDVGAVLLVGAGPNFCAGGDVRDFAAAQDRSAHLYHRPPTLHVYVGARPPPPVPVVAAVHGWAAGAGMSLVCAADIAIGGPGTRMRPAYPGVGLSPDGGMSWTLPRLVGTAKAREILLTDAVLDAAEAQRLGILARIAESDEAVRDDARELARTLARGPRASYAAIRTLLSRSATATLGEQLDTERDAMGAAAGSPTGREGVDAYLAKRAPDYSGLS